MAISIGDRLPDFDFKVMKDGEPTNASVAEIFAGKKIVLFAVPGAFTPTCHRNHLPGYLEHLDTIKSRGVDGVAVVSVNDVWVMEAWSKATQGAGKIQFLSDGSAGFAKAIGMSVDLDVAWMGVRSKRYSMIVEDGKVTALNIEVAPGSTVNSGAAAILNQL